MPARLGMPIHLLWCTYIAARIQDRIARLLGSVYNSPLPLPLSAHKYHCTAQPSFRTPESRVSTHSGVTPADLPKILKHPSGLGWHAGGDYGLLPRELPLKELGTGGVA